MAVSQNIFRKSSNVKSSDECTIKLSPDESVPPYHVKRNFRYKNMALCIFLVLCLIAQSYWIVRTIIQLNKTADSNMKSCLKAPQSIWIPHKHNGSHAKTLTNNFYCQSLDHKLSHLIDLLVIANKSTIQLPAGQQQSWVAATRPSTQMLPYRALEDSMSYLQKAPRLRLKDEKGVRILEDGSVEIQQDGVYSVYSIATFVHTPNDTNVPKDELYINRKRLNVQTVILSDKGHREYGQEESLDLSGNFDLRKGDILNPVIRNISSVYRFTAANYWGVYQVRPVGY